MKNMGHWNASAFETIYSADVVITTWFLHRNKSKLLQKIISLQDLAYTTTTTFFKNLPYSVLVIEQKKLSYLNLSKLDKGIKRNTATTVKNFKKIITHTGSALSLFHSKQYPRYLVGQTYFKRARSMFLLQVLLFTATKYQIKNK